MLNDKSVVVTRSATGIRGEAIAYPDGGGC